VEHLHELPEASRDKILARIEERAIHRARKSFKEFVILYGRQMDPDFKFGRHIEVICDRLEQAFYRAWRKSSEAQTDRLQVSLPPGGSKSQTCTRLFPAWCLGVNPRTRFIIVGHGIDFAKDEYGEKIRDIMWSPEYQKIFPGTTLRPDKQAANRFLTTDGGEVICTGIGAKVAGRRAHIILVDDAIVEEDALSKNVRQDLVSGYPSKHRSRLFMQYACAEIVVGTRWCQGDLHDYLEKTDLKSGNPWDIIKIPAILDEASSAFLRRANDNDPDYLSPGTSFWPEFQPTSRLLSLRKSYENNMGRWNAVYQQNPTGEMGTFLSDGDFRRWEFKVRPPIHTKILSLDTAYTEKEYSDYSAFISMGIWKDENVNKSILLDCGKKKLGFTEMIAWCEQLYNKHQPDFFLIEERSSGLALIPELRRRGYPVRAWKTKKDKIARMHAAAPVVQSGLFYVPKPPGDMETAQKAQDFVTEMCSFPDTPHDDLADTMTQFILFCMEKGMIAPTGWQDVETYEPDDPDDDSDDYRPRTYVQSYRGS